MLSLYHVPISFNSRRIWVALIEKGLPFTLKEMQLNGDQFSPEFLALNPFHHIPVLRDGELTLFESLAILDYLEAKYPQPSLLPSRPEDLAQVKMLELVTINELAPALPPLIRQSLGIVTVEAEALEKARTKVNTVLDYAEKRLGSQTYFLGETFSLVEVVLGTITPVLPTLGVSLENHPQLNRWTQSLMERESWQKTQATPEQVAAFRAAMKTLLSKVS